MDDGADPHELYKVLGVDPNCSQETIRKAYIQLIRDTHGDFGQKNVDKFVAVRRAYYILCDEDRRATYDEDGALEEKEAEITTNEVYHNLAKAFNGIVEKLLESDTIDLRSHDVLEQMRTNLKAGLIKLNEGLAEVNQTRNKIAVLRKQIRRKKSGEINLFDNSLKQRETQMREAKAFAKRQIALAEAMYSELDAYESVIEMIHSWQATYTGTASSGTSATTGQIGHTLLIRYEEVEDDG